MSAVSVETPDFDAWRTESAAVRGALLAEIADLVAALVDLEKRIAERRKSVRAIERALGMRSSGRPPSTHPRALRRRSVPGEVLAIVRETVGGLSERDLHAALVAVVGYEVHGSKIAGVLAKLAACGDLEHVARGDGYVWRAVEAHLPLIHLAFGNLKTWLFGTHHGVSPKHLQAYLNEFMFRFNRRFYPMASFNSVMGIGTRTTGPTYEGLYGGGVGAPERAGVRGSAAHRMGRMIPAWRLPRRGRR